MCWEKGNTVKKLLKVFTKLREKAFPLPQLLQNFTITECIYKFVNGKINLQEKSWGWKLTDSGYSPVLTDLPPALPELLSHLMWLHHRLHFCKMYLPQKWSEMHTCLWSLSRHFMYKWKYSGYGRRRFWWSWWSRLKLSSIHKLKIKNWGVWVSTFDIECWHRGPIKIRPTRGAAYFIRSCGNMRHGLEDDD